MGALFAERFVAAHQQVGDFRVVDVGGQLVKNGGNVASYFCTPQGRVIHAVVGPASADTLLAEANWALDLYDEAAMQAVHRQAATVALAHYHAMGGAEAMRPAGPSWGRWRSSGSKEQRIHELFARNPLPPVSDVYDEVFEKLAGQRLSDGAPNLDAAERGLMLAEQTGRPVLFVLHERRDNRRFLEEWSRRTGRPAPGAESLSVLLKQYVTIVLPLEDVPALSQFLRQPPFQAPSRETPLFVVADAQGRQRSAVAGWDVRPDLAHELARGLVETIKEQSPTVSELRRSIRFLQRIDKRLAQELIELVPKARTEAAARLSTRSPGERPASAG